MLSTVIKHRALLGKEKLRYTSVVPGMAKEDDIASMQQVSTLWLLLGDNLAYGSKMAAKLYKP